MDVTRMHEPSDEDLVRRIRAGDGDASQVLFDRYAPRMRSEARRMLRGIVRRRVGDSDVAQEACLAAFHSLDRFEDRGEGSFARWLGAILQHKASDTIRRQLGAAKRGGAREVSTGDEGAAGRDVLGAGPSPSAAASLGEESADVRAALATLPAAYRVVLDLVHRAGMTFVQVAETTGQTANAAAKSYGRAVRALARALRTARGARDGR